MINWIWIWSELDPQLREVTTIYWWSFRSNGFCITFCATTNFHYALVYINLSMYIRKMWFFLYAYYTYIYTHIIHNCMQFTYNIRIIYIFMSYMQNYAYIICELHTIVYNMRNIICIKYVLKYSCIIYTKYVYYIHPIKLYIYSTYFIANIICIFFSCKF